MSFRWSQRNTVGGKSSNCHPRLGRAISSTSPPLRAHQERNLSDSDPLDFVVVRSDNEKIAVPLDVAALSNIRNTCSEIEQGLIGSQAFVRGTIELSRVSPAETYRRQPLAESLWGVINPPAHTRASAATVSPVTQCTLRRREPLSAAHSFHRAVNRKVTVKYDPGPAQAIPGRSRHERTSGPLPALPHQRNGSS